MEINWLAVLAATVAMFAVGGFWYMVPFAKAWGEMHGFEKLNEKDQKEMQAQMGPLYGMQVVVTIISAGALAYFLATRPDIAWYVTAFILWLGFIVPTEVSSVIFGGTESKWIAKKIAISVGGSLAATLVGAWVISLF
jgi:archaellum biogenesis protein FlaJ (TadC family)